MLSSATNSGTHNPLRILTAVLLVCTVFATGCSSKYGVQKTKVNHYPDCYEPIAELRESEYGVEKSTAAGAVIGGLLGAVGGYLATGKAGGAVVGAAVGAAAGGAVGYQTAKSTQDEEDSIRLARYSSDLDVNIGAVDKSTAAAKVARMCYERQFTVAVSEYKSGHISKEQFRSRYQEVVSGMEEAAFILGENNKHSIQVASQYRQALDTESQRMGVPQQALDKQRPKARTSGTKTAAQQKPRQPQLSKAEQQQASAKLSTDEGRQLSKLHERTQAMEKSVEDSKEEERMLQERLAATRKAAEDLMS